jgi:hypothetical protein
MFRMRDTRILIVCHFIANVTIGVSLLLWANLSAESVISQWMPSWLWPWMFIMAGIAALVGIWVPTVAQFAFVFAAIVTGIFGLASGFAVVVNHTLSAVPTTVFLLYITILKIALSRLVRQREDILQKVAKSTEKGRSALGDTADGTTSTAS